MRPRPPAGFLELVRSDLRRFVAAEGRGVTWPVTLRMIFLMPGFQFVLARRIQDLLYSLPVVGRAAGRIWWWRTCRSFGCEIAIAARIGRGFYVPHPFGIVVGICTIGDDVTVLQNVTVGRKRLGDMSVPVIEDGAYLGAGAVVVGAVVIGRNAQIGANAVVVRDIPADAVAVGSPARVVRPRPSGAEDEEASCAS